MKKTLALLLLAGLTLEAQAATDLFWNGSGGHMTWNTEDTNWSQGGASVKYSDGNDVVFVDNGSGTVTLSGTFVPASVTVTSLEDYIFDGTGKLTGNMQLNKFQTGTLTINTANDYTGDTNIYKGTLVIGNDHALGTGTIKLFDNTTLNLGQKNLSNKVSLEQGETAFIGNGSISSDLIVGNGKTLTLIGNLDGRGEITLGQSTTLDLGNNTLYNNVSLSGETASIGNGSIHGDVVVGDGKTLIFIGNLKVYGQINLGNNTTLHLGKNSLFNDVSLSGSASIGNGYIHGDVVVGNGKTLTLIDKLDGGGEIKLSDNATLNLGQYTHHINVALAGETAFIGNGCIDSVLSVGDGKTLTLIGDLEGYQINLGNNTTLDLGNNTLNMYHVSLSGSTTIGNGTIEGDLQVAEGKKLSLQQQITVTGTVNLAANAALDLGGNAFHQGGDVGNRVAFAGDATIGNGTITGDLDVAANQNLTLLHDTTVTGTVNLAANAALDLGKNAFHQGGDVGNRVAFAGDATIGNGTITGDLTVAAGKQITLLAGTTITGGVTLGDNASLDLGKNAVTGAVTLAGSATIGNGTIEGGLAVEEGKSLALLENTTVTGAISLGQNSTLNLGGATCAANTLTFKGNSATIGNGTINGDLTVAENKSLALLANTTVTGGVSLGAQSSLNLGGNTFHTGGEGGSQVTFSGDATVSNGTLVLDSDWSPGYTFTFTDITLDLNKHTLSQAVSLKGNNTIGNGTITGDLSLTASSRINLLENTSITGGVTLGDNASLDLGKNAVTGAVTLSGSATIGNGTIEGGLAVAENKSLALLANTTVTGAISLGQNSTLNLGGGSLSSNVFLGWDTTIGGGTLNGEISFAVKNQQLSLCGDLGGTGDIAIGVVNKNSSSPIGIDPPHPVFTSSLDMGGHTLSKGLKLDGDTTVSNGRLVLAHDMTRSLDDIQARTVTIGAETTVDLNSHTFSHDLAVEADTAIGNGTIGGNVTVDEGKSVRFFGETKIDSNNEGLVSYHGKIEIGGTTIQALHRPPESQIGAPVYPGLMKELTVSEKEIVGTGRASSLADGLEIQSESDLLIKGMTITADNKISVGDNTITLQDVTIKLSQTSYDIVDGVYYFTLSDLFHCSVDMTDVTFDASALELPKGFDPEKNAISFNLGDAWLTDATDQENITLLMGRYGSQTMSIDAQGRPVFKNLVETPEPTTGVLSLLGLGLLAGRRRKHN